MNVYGKVRGQGANSRYAGGERLERLMIHAERVDDEYAPGENSVRVPVTVRIGTRRFHGGLLLRHSPPPFVSLSPDLTDAESGEETNLATVLNAAQIQKNQEELLALSDIQLTLTALQAPQPDSPSTPAADSQARGPGLTPNCSPDDTLGPSRGQPAC